MAPASREERRLQTQIVAGVGLLATIAIRRGLPQRHIRWEVGPTWLLGVLLALLVLATATLGAAMRWIPCGDFFFDAGASALHSRHPRQLGPPAAFALAWSGRKQRRVLRPAGGLITPGARHACRECRAGQRRLGRHRQRRLGLPGARPATGIVLIAAAMVGTMYGLAGASCSASAIRYWAPLSLSALMPALAAIDVWRRTLELVL